VPLSYFPELEVYLYVDQVDLSSQVQSGHPVMGGTEFDTFVFLMENCNRTTPLGSNEYSLLSYDIVKKENGVEKLEHQYVHIFTDGTIILFKDGEVQTSADGKYRVEEIQGQRGSVGFGTSPNCDFGHVIVEYQIPFTSFRGNSYSPNQFFLQGVIPPRKKVAALFKGFSGTGDGVKEIEQLFLNHPDIVVDTNVYAATGEQDEAMDFLRPYANTAGIVLIGHSAGGDAIIEMGERLMNESLAVDELVQIDSVTILDPSDDDILPENVETGLNYWQRRDIIAFPPDPFEGEREVLGSTNVDAETHFPWENITHSNIDNVDCLQNEILSLAINGKLPTGAGVVPPFNTLTQDKNDLPRKITIPKPFIIDGTNKAKSKSRWDSGDISLEAPILLRGTDKTFIDTYFENPVLLKMIDKSNTSNEKVQVELYGTVIVPDTNDDFRDELKVGFEINYFDGEIQYGQTAQTIVIPSGSGTGAFAETINFTTTEFRLEGFTLEIVQDETGETQINGFRVLLEADEIIREIPKSSIQSHIDDTPSAISTNKSIESSRITDIDEDGVLDELDNCQIIANVNQKDSDINGIGNACEIFNVQYNAAGLLEVNLDGSITFKPSESDHTNANSLLSGATDVQAICNYIYLPLITK
jgi:hypothetical protein